MLVYLRSGLGTAATRLATDREYAALGIGAGECDALAFEAAARSASSASPDLDLLRAAAARYRGPLLAGLELGEAEGFDQWLDERREAVRAQAEVIFGCLSERLLEQDPLAAASLASRWVHLDRLSEAAWQRLILARLDAGQPSLAREAYETCRKVLRGELGLTPGPELLALEARLWRPGPTRAPEHRPDLHALLLGGPLVGRASELTRLVAAYQRAAGGVPGTVVIAGEPGIGKSRLAAAFLDWAGHQGAYVLRGRAFESSAATPFGPLAELLRRLMRREAEPQRLLGPTWLAELSRLMPELRDRLPDLPLPRDDPGGRQRLLEALTELGLALANRSPAILMIDDLQWADESTLDALYYAAARFVEEETRVLLVLTARSEALLPASGLSARLTNLGREVGLTRLNLGSLGLSETRQWLGGLTGHADEPTLQALSGRLFSATGGHPLYLSETLRSLLERGALMLRGGQLRVDEAQLDVAVPGVRAVIESRLAPLPFPALRLAQASAVLEEPATFNELRCTAGLGEEEGLTGLEALLRTGLLHEADVNTGAHYLLSHDRVRETLTALLGAERCRMMHREAAAALEAVDPQQGEQLAARRARHLEAAGEDERAALAYRQAGGWALRSAAPRAAAAMLERALALTPATREHQESRSALLARIAQALDSFDDGSLAAVEAHWRTAAERARDAGLPGEECEVFCSLSKSALPQRRTSGGSARQRRGRWRSP